MAKFHEKNQVVYAAIQGVNGTKIATGTATLSGVAITGTGGQFSCTAANLYVGQQLVISGTLGGTGTISGYTNPTTYYIIATNGTTTFTLSTSQGGTAITTTAGTPTGLTYTINSLIGQEAVAATSVTADPTIDTGALQYLGDSLSRDEYTYQKDRYIDLQLETFQQVLYSTAAAIDPNTNSIWKLLQACGGDVTVDGTTKFVTTTNIVDSADMLTVDWRMSTPDDAVNDKLYKFWDLRGTVDVAASIGEPPTLKFSLKGNADTPVAAAKQTANFGVQTTRVAPALLNTTMLNAQLAFIDDTFTSNVGTYTSGTYSQYKTTITFSAPHSLPVGSIIMVSVSGITNPTSSNGNFMAYVDSTTTVSYFVKGQTGSGSLTGTVVCKKGDTAVKSVCFSTLSAPNFFGFDFQRFLTGCETGFAKGAVPTDVSMTIVEDQAGASSFDPDANLTKFYALIVRFGLNTTGNNIAYMWNKLQVANVKQGKVATYFGRDITFRNTGQSFILHH